MDQYDIERILARGTFGTVYLCHLKKDLRKQVVVKKLAMEIFNNNDRIGALNETKVLSMLNHPNIIKYYESFLSSDEASMYIVMEYAPGGTLFDLIDQRRKLMALSRESGENNPDSGYFQGLN